jgi:hypothetical protein
MIHPSAQAIDYIWDHFSTSFMSNESLSFIEKWSKIVNAMSHKPFNPATAEHQKFLVNTLRNLEALKTMVNVDKEIAVVKNQIMDA